MAGGNIGDAMQVKLRGNILSFLVTSGQTIYRGSAVALNTSAGTVVAAGDDSNRRFVGFAEEKVVGDGTKRIKVRRRGIFKLRKDGDTVAATEIGSVVCAQDNQTSSQDQTFENLSTASNDVVVGVVVGVDLVADRWWVDIIAAGFENYNMASYSTTSELALHTTGHGVEGLGVEENIGFGSTPTLQDVLEGFLANGHINVPLTSFMLLDGTALLKQTGSVAGLQILNTPKEMCIEYQDTEGDDAIIAQVAMPQDYDNAEDCTVHLLVSKDGTDNSDVALDLAAYFVGVGDDGNADAQDTGEITLTDVSGTPEELVFTIGSGGEGAATPSVLNLVVGVTTSGSDNVHIYGVWIEYIRDLAGFAI